MIDVIDLSEIAETEVDPRNNATTIHTGLQLSDGGEGFLIVGRIVRDRKTKWKPLKEVISKIIVEYNYEQDKNAPPIFTAEENPVHSEQDNGGKSGDGKQTVGRKPRNNTAGRKGSKGV